MNILWFVDKQFDIALDRSTWVEIIKYLQKNNNVYLITGYKKNKYQFDELDNNIIYIKSYQYSYINRIMFYYNQIKSLKKIIEVYKPNIFFFNTVNFILINKISKFKKKYDYKAFLDIRTLPVNFSNLKNYISKLLLKNTLRISSKNFDGITYITEELRQYCQKKYNLSPHVSVVWSSGVNPELFKRSEGKKDFKKFRIIYHGNIARNRGLDNVVKAMSLLRCSNFEFLLLGNGDGLQYLKKLVSELRMEDKIFFYKIIPYNKVSEFLNSCDVGILPFPNWPGWNVSSPIKLFEYLACGLPVIVTKIPAHKNVLWGKDFAFWAEDSSPDEIAKAIKKVYNAKDRLDKLSQSARNFVIHNYTWEKQAYKLDEFLILQNQ